MDDPPSEQGGADVAASPDGRAVPRRDERGELRKWRILTVVLIGSFMAVLDTTIVNVALPSIAAGTHAGSAALEWVVSGYALTFGLVLVPAGRIGDRFGFKRLFLTGMAVFTLASLGCGLSRSTGELVAARFVQGAGAGIYYPAVSGTIQRLFSGTDRSRAFGYVGAAVGVSTALGPLLGGLIIQELGVHDGWRWVFLINVFIGAVALPAAARMLPGRRKPEQHRFDPAGNAILAGVLLLLLVPLVEGRADGWPPWSWLCLGGAAGAGVVLAVWEIAAERRGGEPVIQPALLRHRAFAVGQSLALAYFGGFTSLFFVLSILWQQGLGRSALATGLLLVPFAVPSLITAANSHRFSARFGRMTVTGGICGMAAGQALVLAALHFGGPHPSGWLLAGPLLLAGLGNGLVIAPNQDFVLASVPRQQAGTAGGSLLTAQRIGAAIGIAVVGTALFGTGSAAARLNPALLHTAQWATVADLGFMLFALVLSRGLPASLGAARASGNR